MDLKEYCVGVAREQFGSIGKIDSAHERLELIKSLIRNIEKAQNDMRAMTELLQRLEKYELQEDQKLDTMLNDMEQREGWK